MTMKAIFSSPRRRIIWSKVRGVKSVSALAIATAFGAGLFPIAPGTMGTLAGIPLAYSTGLEFSLIGRVFFWIALILIGTWSAKVFDEMMGTGDNQNIVIDEVIGLGISAWTAGTDATTWLAAFCLFRFFDVLKPFPVRQIDRWSKSQSSAWWGGFGVIADDIVAGFQALLVILFLQWLLVL